VAGTSTPYPRVPGRDRTHLTVDNPGISQR